MQSNNLQKALNRVISFCNAIINLEGSPSDDEIEMCERILQIINEELEKK